jgi:hypothetical protein
MIAITQTGGSSTWRSQHRYEGSQQRRKSLKHQILFIINRISYSGDRDQADHGLKLASEKDSVLTKKLGLVVCACHLSYKESINSGIVIQASPGINVRLLRK